MEFQPIVGLRTEDSYMHGCGELEDINVSGEIVYVDDNCFLLKTDESNSIMVGCDSYWVFNEGDFK